MLEKEKEKVFIVNTPTPINSFLTLKKKEGVGNDDSFLVSALW